MRITGLGALALVVLAPSAISAQDRPDVGSEGIGIETAAWLQGCWATSGGGTRTEEVWMAPAGGVMVGMGRSVPQGRTASWEHLLLRVTGGGLTYSALPSGQRAVDFLQVPAPPGQLRFENPDHDFPRGIAYSSPAPDQLLASVFGEAGGVDPAFTLRFSRVACPS